jgi:hypothetical protein
MTCPSFQGDEEGLKGLEDPWHTIDDLSSNASSKTVFGLKPNSTYYFRVYAVNELGPGPNVSVEAETKFNLEEIDQVSILRISFSVKKFVGLAKKFIENLQKIYLVFIEKVLRLKRTKKSFCPQEKMYLVPILRLLNLQLQSQCCIKL